MLDMPWCMMVHGSSCPHFPCHHVKDLLGVGGFCAHPAHQLDTFKTGGPIHLTQWKKDKIQKFVGPGCLSINKI